LKKFGHGVECCRGSSSMEKQQNTQTEQVHSGTETAAADVLETAVVPGIEPAIKTSGEVGGPQGLEPTRYGDWEKQGRCIDF
jgi:hypothetical protein